jgi:hypothetical protein
VTRILGSWAGLTLLASVALHQLGRIDEAPAPPSGARAWAMATFAAARGGAELPPPPPAVADHRATGPVISLAWRRGRVRARHVGDAQLAASVRAAARSFAADPSLKSATFTVSVPRGEGPLLGFVPMLSSLFVVPLREGLAAELDGGHAFLTPDEMVAAGLYDSAVDTPIPDLSFGTDLPRAAGRLGEQLAVGGKTLLERGNLKRVRMDTLTPTPYPGDGRVSREHLRRAAREGAEFLLRHQRKDGRYTYLYDGGRGRRVRSRRYSMPRHAGTTYFLAQAARRLDMPEARRGALRALSWVRDEMTTTCGARDRQCVRKGNVADMGSAALTALAAAEVLAGQDDPQVRGQLKGLNSFIRSMQRPDGELMHIYDLRRDRPLDIQKMYFSGEAAYALLASHRVMPDPRDLQTARRLMGHLTGAAWSFFGSRYFYGEEHWTCQAAALAVEHMPVDDGLSFCLRWLDFQRQLQYQPGETPWPVHGAIGVGPVVVPRLTAVASRVEAGAQLYRLARDRGLPTGELRAQLEASLSLLLRMRWSPGPIHLLADPAGALGGVPGTQASLEVRNDFVQHAGSAMLLWDEILAEETP